VDQHLLKPYGVLILSPAYTKWQERIGRITHDVPGHKENGSAYSHCTVWWAQALLRLGKPDEALDVLRRALPGNPDNHFTKSGQHPAYMPNGYMGPAGREHEGRGSNHNWTGSAAAFFWVCMHELLGLQGTPVGLRIAPRLPSSWDRASVRFAFRGATLEIMYRRGARAAVRCGDCAVEGRVLSGLESGRTYRVEAVVA
jgi:cellobionic acid phosphorylase